MSVNSSPKTTFIVPCFNEGARLADSLATLETWFGDTVQLVMVDDGSTDDTFERAQRYAAGRAHVEVHRLASNSGKGAAVRTGISFAGGSRIVLMDADLAYDRESVLRVLDGLERADVVVGNRRHDGSRYSVPVRLFGFLYRRHLVGLAFNAFVRMLFQLRIRDTQCGLKGFRREALERIVPALSMDGFTIDIEILLVARGLGLSLVEVPVQVTYESAKSSVRLARTAVAMGLEIFAIMVRRALGRYSSAQVQAAAARAQRLPQSQSQKERVR